MGSGIYVYGGKKGGMEKKEEKKIEREKTKLVLFICSLCLVQSVELWKKNLEDVYDIFFLS